MWGMENDSMVWIVNILTIVSILWTNCSLSKLTPLPRLHLEQRSTLLVDLVLLPFAVALPASPGRNRSKEVFQETCFQDGHRRKKLHKELSSVEANRAGGWHCFPMGPDNWESWRSTPHAVYHLVMSGSYTHAGSLLWWAVISINCMEITAWKWLC